MEDAKDKSYIVLTDEDGKDTKVELLFSIVYKPTSVRYLYIVDPGDADAVLIFSSDDEGNVELVQHDAITPVLEEFLENTFQAYQSGDLVPAAGDESDEEEDGASEYCDDEGCRCGEKPPVGSEK